MAPVAIKYIVSFTSQDDHHKVQNLLTGDGFKKWLSHPKEKSGGIEAVLQLEEFYQLAYIDIGSHWCASIEIKVGRSDWPQNTLYHTLIPTSSLMTPVECKLGKGIVKTRMFSSGRKCILVPQGRLIFNRFETSTENFAPDVAAEKWDRIQVVLRQPYRKDVQYGLSFIRIKVAGSKTGSYVESSTKPLVSLCTTKSVVSIQKHFFGQKSESSKSPDPVKSRLLKIAGSTENGSEQIGVLSRTAKLVLSASENAGKYSPQARAGPSKSAKMALFSEHLAQKYGSSFEEEVDELLNTLQLPDLDLDHVTIADLRHRFEKRKKRKLTADEKKIFMEKCGDYICNLFDAAERNKDRRITSSLPDIEDDTSPALSPKSYKKSSDKLYSTPLSCKRKSENEADVVRTPKTPRLHVDSDTRSVDMVTPKTNRSVKLTTPQHTMFYAGSGISTLNSQRGLITQVEKAFGPTDRTDSRVPFTSKSLNSETGNVTPKSSKKGKSTKPSTKDSPAERRDTCGMWLSKDKGPSLAEKVEKSPVVNGRQKTPRGARGRGRGRRGGKNETRTGDRGKTGTDEHDEEETRPGYGNYVYCSTCKGNVPERVFSDHFIKCNRNDASSSTYRNLSPSPPPQTSTSSSINKSYTSVPAIDSAINISGDSDVMITNDSLNLVECPLCGEFYSADIITVHADVCASAMEMSGL